MVHVTWGKNTVFNPPNTAAATTPPATPKSTNAFSFGSTTGASSSVFNSSTSATASTPTPTAFSFSSNPVTTPSLSTSTPAPSTPSLFTSSTTNNTASAPTTSTFFSPSAPVATPSFNTTPATAPQQAAIQAHFNATLHQESSQLQQQLLQLHAAYNPTPQSQSMQQQQGQSQNQFQFIFYDPMTPSQHLEKITLGATAAYPQKPPSISSSTWNMALSSNPNPDEYIPVIITNANELHSRIVSQQSTTDLLSNYIATISNKITSMKDKHNALKIVLHQYDSKYKTTSFKLMQIMKKIDLCRGKYMTLQTSEIEIKTKLQTVWNSLNILGEMMKKCQYESQVFYQKIHELEQMKRYYYGGSGDGGIVHLQGTGNSSGNNQGCNVNDLQLGDEYKQEVHQLLDQCSNGIEELRICVNKDERDLKIIKRGILMK